MVRQDDCNCCYVWLMGYRGMLFVGWMGNGWGSRAGRLTAAALKVGPTVNTGP